MRYFLKLAYSGLNFHGWQIQPNAVSVQQTIEKALGILLRQEISIVGAGRTDTGVNARVMYAHFDIDRPVEDKKRFLNSINKLLGKDIAIFDIVEVSAEDHARFSATERTYKYFIGYSKNPFLNKYFCFSHQDLDIRLMNEAAKILLDTSDFTSFAKLHSDVKTNICKVSHAKWDYIENDKESLNFLGNFSHGIVFTISADRFLRNMVRAITGTLIEVGRNKIDINTFKEIIDSKDRCSAGSSMPAEALFLWDIKYPFLP